MLIVPTNEFVNIKEFAVGDLFFIKDDLGIVNSGLAICTNQGGNEGFTSYQIISGPSAGHRGSYLPIPTPAAFRKYKVIAMPQKGDKVTLVYHNNNVRVEAVVSHASAFYATCSIFNGLTVHLEMKEDGIYDADWNAKVDIEYGHAPVNVPSQVAV